MSHIQSPREIIDRRRLAAAVEADEDASVETKRARLVEVLKDALKSGTAAIRGRLESGRANGLETVAAHSYLMDQIIRVLFDAVTTHFMPSGVRTTGERLSIVALGGYGRGELAPLSDIDLLFLLPYKQTPWGESVVEAILYFLWDLRQKVGHSTRSVDECLRQARDDMTVRTALLESRFILGDEDRRLAHSRPSKGTLVSLVVSALGRLLARCPARTM